MSLEAVKPFQPKEIDVETSSGKSYKLRQLNGAQQLNADSTQPATASSSAYYRTVMSIAQIDGQEVTQAMSGVELKALLQALSGTDVDELLIAYVRAFAPQPAELKNE